ncbi:hypothetical protein ElyMa_000116100 [Elysia marginata]|uniref:WAP domain-containing protein n=1 Tax=Elysia marginata TaxID=1093978 RepID=A0AAV4EMU9_9GAST|nr:hypothetical protein ElyMa_000116100 [Elysia marginata]
MQSPGRPGEHELFTKASSCSWSNEDCSDNSDCCSKSCHKAHEGTNPRCRHSTLGEPCVFDYHCQDSLECGNQYNCCSPFWKMCIKNSDCCDPAHVCRSADGFDYDRCLFPSAAIRPSLWSPYFILLIPFLSSALAQRLAEAPRWADLCSTSTITFVFILSLTVLARACTFDPASSGGDISYGAVG